MRMFSKPPVLGTIIVIVVALVAGAALLPILDAGTTSLYTSIEGDYCYPKELGDGGDARSTAIAGYAVAQQTAQAINTATADKIPPTIAPLFPPAFPASAGSTPVARTFTSNTTGQVVTAYYTLDGYLYQSGAASAASAPAGTAFNTLCVATAVAAQNIVVPVAIGAVTDAASVDNVYLRDFSSSKTAADFDHKVPASTNNFTPLLLAIVGLVFVAIVLVVVISFFRGRK